MRGNLRRLYKMDPALRQQLKLYAVTGNEKRRIGKCMKVGREALRGVKTINETDQEYGFIRYRQGSGRKEIVRFSVRMAALQFLVMALPPIVPFTGIHSGTIIPRHCDSLSP
jgi:hypothetical protein